MTEQLKQLTPEEDDKELNQALKYVGTTIAIYENIKNLVQQMGKVESGTEIENLKSQILTEIAKTDGVVDEDIDRFLQRTYGYNYKIVEMNSRLKDLVRSAW
ncbi:MAG: hypothetical protein LBF32_01810 [Streptococcaceae bacterium]|nr:hypothetical protein [Streptococcaceae bacterium]